jgi:hypothetical protein
LALIYLAVRQHHNGVVAGLAWMRWKYASVTEIKLTSHHPRAFGYKA